MGARDDGDTIRGLGFVALYSAYLEGAIDECVEALSRMGDSPEAKCPVSRKIAFCVQQLEKLASYDDMVFVSGALRRSKLLFEQRNDVVHGRIYAQFDHPDIRKSGRPGVPDRIITSEELYQLANEIYNNIGHVMHGASYSIPDAVAKYANDTSGP